jgi:hypothetical protein
MMAGQLTDDWTLQTKDASAKSTTDQLTSSIDAIKPDFGGLSVPPAGPPSATPTPSTTSAPSATTASTPAMDASQSLSLGIDALKPDFGGLSVPPVGRPPATPSPAPFGPGIYQTQTPAAQFATAKGGLSTQPHTPVYRPDVASYIPPTQPGDLSIPPAPQIIGTFDRPMRTFRDWLRGAGLDLNTLGALPAMKSSDELVAKTRVDPWSQAYAPGGLTPVGVPLGQVTQTVGAALEYAGANVKDSAARNAPDINLRDEWRQRGLSEESIVFGERFGRSVIAPILNAPQGSLDALSDVGYYTGRSISNIRQGEFKTAGGDLLDAAFAFGDFADNIGLLIPGAGLVMTGINAAGAVMGSITELSLRNRGFNDAEARRWGNTAEGLTQAAMIVHELISNVRSIRRLSGEMRSRYAEQERRLTQYLAELGIEDVDNLSDTVRNLQTKRALETGRVGASELTSMLADEAQAARTLSQVKEGRQIARQVVDNLVSPLRSERNWLRADVGATIAGGAIGGYQQYQDLIDQGKDPSQFDTQDWLSLITAAADKGDAMQSVTQGVQMGAAGAGKLGTLARATFRSIYGRRFAEAQGSGSLSSDSNPDSFRQIDPTGTYDLGVRDAMGLTQPASEAAMQPFVEAIRANPNMSQQAFQNLITSVLPGDTESLPLSTKRPKEAPPDWTPPPNQLNATQARALTDPTIGQAHATPWSTERLAFDENVPQHDERQSVAGVALVVGDLDVTIGADGKDVVRQITGTNYAEGMAGVGRPPIDPNRPDWQGNMSTEPTFVPVPRDADVYLGAFGVYRIEWQQNDGSTRQLFLTTNGAIGGPRKLRQNANQTAKAPASLSIFDPAMHAGQSTVAVSTIAPNSRVDDLRAGDYVLTQWVPADTNAPTTPPPNDVDIAVRYPDSLVSDDVKLVDPQAIDTSAGATSYRLPSGFEAIVSDAWTPATRTIRGQQVSGYQRTVSLRSRQANNTFDLNVKMAQDYADYGAGGEYLVNWYPLMGQVFAAIANGIDVRTGRRVPGFNASPRLKLVLTKMLGAIWGETTSQTAPDDNLRKTLVILGVGMDFRRARRDWFAGLDANAQNTLTNGGFVVDRQPMPGELGEMLAEGKLTVRLQTDGKGNYLERPGSVQKVKDKAGANQQNAEDVGDEEPDEIRDEPGARWEGIVRPYQASDYTDVDPNGEWTTIPAPVAGEIDDAGQPIIDPTTGRQKVNNLWKVSTYAPRGVAPTQASDRRYGMFGNLKLNAEVAGTLDALNDEMRVVLSNFKSTQFTFQSVLSLMNGYVPGSVIDVHAYSGAGFDPRTTLSGKVPTALRTHIAQLQAMLPSATGATRARIEADLNASIALRAQVSKSSSDGETVYNANFGREAIRGSGTNPVQSEVEPFWIVEGMYREIARQMGLPQDAVQAILWFAAKNEISPGEWNRQTLVGPVKLGDNWVDAPAGTGMLAGSVTQTADVNAPLINQFYEFIKPYLVTDPATGEQNFGPVAKSKVLDARVNLPVLHIPDASPQLDTTGRSIATPQDALSLATLTKLIKKQTDTQIKDALQTIHDIVKKWGAKSLQKLANDSDEPSAYQLLNDGKVTSASPGYDVDEPRLRAAVTYLADNGWSRDSNAPTADVEIVAQPSYETRTQGFLTRVRNQVKRLGLSTSESSIKYKSDLSKETLRSETIVDAARYAAAVGPRAIIPVADATQALSTLVQRGVMVEAPQTYGLPTYAQTSYRLNLPTMPAGRLLAHRVYADGNNLIVEGDWTGSDDNVTRLGQQVLAPLADALGIDRNTPVEVSQVLGVDNSPIGLAPTGLSLVVTAPGTPDALRRALNAKLPAGTATLTEAPKVDDGKARVIITPTGNATPASIRNAVAGIKGASIGQTANKTQTITMNGDRIADRSAGNDVVVVSSTANGTTPDVKAISNDINRTRVASEVRDALASLVRSTSRLMRDVVYGASVNLSPAEQQLLDSRLDTMKVHLETGNETFGNFYAQRENGRPALSINAHVLTDGATLLLEDGVDIADVRELLAKGILNTVIHELMHAYGFRHDSERSGRGFASEDEYNAYQAETVARMMEQRSYDALYTQAVRMAEWLLARNERAYEWQNQSRSLVQALGEQYAVAARNTQSNGGVDAVDANADLRRTVADQLARQRNATGGYGAGTTGVSTDLVGAPTAVPAGTSSSVVGRVVRNAGRVGNAGTSRRSRGGNAPADVVSGGLGDVGANGAGVDASTGGGVGAPAVRETGATPVGRVATVASGANVGAAVDDDLIQPSTTLPPGRGAYMDRPASVDDAWVRAGGIVRAVGADDSYYVMPATEDHPAVLVGSITRRLNQYDNEFDPSQGGAGKVAAPWQRLAQQIARSAWAERYRQDVRTASTYIWEYLVSLGLAPASGSNADIGRAYRSMAANNLVVDNVIDAEQRYEDFSSRSPEWVVPTDQYTFPGVNRNRDRSFRVARGQSIVPPYGAIRTPTARQSAIATAKLLPRQMMNPGPNPSTTPDNGAFLSRVGPIDDVFILIDNTTLGVAFTGTLSQDLIAPSRVTPWQINPTRFQPPAFRPAPSAVGLNPMNAYLTAMAFARRFPRINVTPINRNIFSRSGTPSVEAFGEEHVRSLWAWSQVGVLVHEMVHRAGILHRGPMSRGAYDEIVGALVSGAVDPYAPTAPMPYQRRDAQLRTRDVQPGQVGDVGRSMNPLVRLLMGTYDYLIANGLDDSAKMAVDETAQRLHGTYMTRATLDDATAVAQSNWTNQPPQEVRGITGMSTYQLGSVKLNPNTYENQVYSPPSFPAGTFADPTVGEDNRTGTIGPDGRPQASSSLVGSTITAGFGNAGWARIKALGLEAPPEFAGLYAGKSRQEVAQTQLDHLKGIGLMDSRGRLVDFDRLNVPYRIRYGGFGSWADSPETKGGLYSAGYEDNLYIEVPSDVPDDYVRGLAAVVGLSDLQSAMGARRFHVRDPQQATLGMVAVTIPDGEREDPVGWLLREHEGLQPTFSANIPDIDWVVGSAWEADPGGAFAYMIPYEAFGVKNDTPDARSARLDNWSAQVLNTLYGYGVSDRIVKVVDVDVATVGQWGEPYGQAIAKLNGLQPWAGGPAGGLRVPATGGRRVGAARERGLGDQAGVGLADVYAPADAQRQAVPAGRSGAPYYTVAWATKRVQNAASYYRTAYGYRTADGRFRADVTADLSAPDVGIIGGDRASLPQASTTLAGDVNGRSIRQGDGLADAVGAYGFTAPRTDGASFDRGIRRGFGAPGVRDTVGSQGDGNAGVGSRSGVGRGGGSLAQSSTSLPTDDDLRYVVGSRYGSSPTKAYYPPLPYVVTQDLSTGRPAVAYYARQRLGVLRQNLPRDPNELARFADQAALSPAVAQFLAGAKVATDYWSEHLIRLGVLPRSPADWESSMRSDALNDLIRRGASRSDAGFDTLTPEQKAYSIGWTVRKQQGSTNERSIQPVSTVGINIDPQLLGVSLMGWRADEMGATARPNAPVDPDRPEGFAPTSDIILMNPFYLWASLDSVDQTLRRLGMGPLAMEKRRLLWSYAIAGLSGHETLHHAGPLHTGADPDEQGFVEVLRSLAPGATPGRRNEAEFNDGVDRTGLPLAPLLRTLMRQYDTLEAGDMRALTREWLQAMAAEYRRGYNSDRTDPSLQITEDRARTDTADMFSSGKQNLARQASSLNVPQSIQFHLNDIQDLDEGRPMELPDAPGYAEDLLPQASTTLPDVDYLMPQRGDVGRNRRTYGRDFTAETGLIDVVAGDGRIGATGGVPIVSTTDMDLARTLRSSWLAIPEDRQALAQRISTEPWSRTYTDLLARTARYWSDQLIALGMVPQTPDDWSSASRLRAVNDIVSRAVKTREGVQKQYNLAYDAPALDAATQLLSSNSLTPEERARLMGEIVGVQGEPSDRKQRTIAPVIEAGILFNDTNIGMAINGRVAADAGAQNVSTAEQRSDMTAAGIPVGYQPVGSILTVNPLMIAQSLDAVDAWLIDGRKPRLTHQQRRYIWALAHTGISAHEAVHFAGPLHGVGDPTGRLFDDIVRLVLGRASAIPDPSSRWTDAVDRTPGATRGVAIAPVMRSWMRTYDTLSQDPQFAQATRDWFDTGVSDNRRRLLARASNESDPGRRSALEQLANEAQYVSRRAALQSRNYFGGTDEYFGTPFDAEQIPAQTDDTPLPSGVADDRPGGPRYLEDVQSSTSLPDGRMKPGERKRTVDRQGLPLTDVGDRWVASLADTLAWREVPTTAGIERLNDANGNPITPAQRQRMRVEEAGRRLKAREEIKREIVNRFGELWSGGYVATGGVIDENLPPPPRASSARQAIEDIVAVDPTFVDTAALIGALGRGGGGRTLIDSNEMRAVVGDRFVRGVTRLRYASMLSGTAGAVSDMIGNALMGGVVEVPRRIIQAGVESSMEKVGLINRRDRIIFSDGATKATWAGFTGAFANAIKAASDFLVEGGEGVRSEGQRTLISGKLGIIPEIGLRSRMAADAFVHTLGLGISTAQVVDREMQKRGLRWGTPEYRGKSSDLRRSLASRLRKTGEDAPNITDNTLEGEIMRGAAGMVFQEPFRGIFGLESMRDSTQSLFWNLLIPFYRTTANIAVTSFEMTPIVGAIPLGIDLAASYLNRGPYAPERLSYSERPSFDPYNPTQPAPELHLSKAQRTSGIPDRDPDWNRLTRTSDIKVKPAVQRISMQILGTMYAGLAAGMYAAGMMTGGGPGDEKERKALEKDGWKPFALHIGDQYYEVIKLIGPLALPMMMGAGIAEVVDRYGQYPTTALVQAMATSMGSWLTQNAGLDSLRQAGDFVESMWTLDKPNFARSSANMVSSFVPYSGLVRQVAKAIDPYDRETQTFVDNLLAMVPGIRQDLPAKRDDLGRTYPRDEGMSGIRAMLPLQSTTDVTGRRDPYRFVASRSYLDDARTANARAEVDKWMQDMSQPAPSDERFSRAVTSRESPIYAILRSRELARQKAEQTQGAR